VRKLTKRLKRRTQRERLGEKWPTKRSHWLKLFPREIQRTENLNRVRPKIEKKILGQPQAQEIGELREKKVLDALEDLKEKREIQNYLSQGKLSYADLGGVDFIFVYVNDGAYKVCRFSVTGERWIKKHQERHPEIPVIPVDLNESRESIEQRVLALRNFH